MTAEKIIMTIQDIMIGDWVKDGNVYAQVTAITCDGIIKTTHNPHSNIELIKPIPLTAEILEKNGFRKRPYPNIEKHHQWIFCAGCTITLWCCRLFDNTDEGWMIDIDDAFCHSCRVHIKYLHELQHALRLCGITKTIEL